MQLDIVPYESYDEEHRKYDSQPRNNPENFMACSKALFKWLSRVAVKIDQLYGKQSCGISFDDTNVTRFKYAFLAPSNHFTEEMDVAVLMPIWKVAYPEYEYKYSADDYFNLRATIA